MCKWNYLIILVVLMPPRQALEENPSTVEPDLSTKLFREIDEYLNDLILNHEAIRQHSSLCASNWQTFDDTDDEDRESSLVPMLKDQFQLLEKHVHSLNLAKECPNMENNINEYRNSFKIDADTYNNITNNLSANLKNNATT